MSLFFHSQLYYCLPSLGKESQKFYGGAVGQSENFYSAGKITFQMGSYSEDTFHLTPFLECGKRGVISFISGSG